MPRGQPRGPRQRPGAQAAEARAPLLAGAAALAASECRKVLRRLRVVTDKREKRREGLPFARMLAKIAHANALAVFDAIVGLARPGPIPFFFFFPFAGEKQVLSCQRLEGRWRRGVRLHAGERAPPNLSGVLADARAGDDGVDVHQPLRWWIGGCQPAGRSGARRMSDLRGPNCVWIDVQWSCRRGVALQRSMQGLRPLGCSEAAQKAMTPLPGQTRP